MAEQEPETKVALITGGGTGIGNAIGIALARDGFAVAAVGRRIEPLEEAKKDGFQPYL